MCKALLRPNCNEPTCATTSALRGIAPTASASVGIPCPSVNPAMKTGGGGKLVRKSSGGEKCTTSWVVLNQTEPSCSLRNGCSLTHGGDSPSLPSSRIHSPAFAASGVA